MPQAGSVCHPRHESCSSGSEGQLLTVMTAGQGYEAGSPRTNATRAEYTCLRLQNYYDSRETNGIHTDPSVTGIIRHA